MGSKAWRRVRPRISSAQAEVEELSDNLRVIAVCHYCPKALPCPKLSRKL